MDKDVQYNRLIHKSGRQEYWLNNIEYTEDQFNMMQFTKGIKLNV